MSLSSNSIIHLTDKKNFLEGIIKEGFKIRLCKENIILNEEPIEFRVPMVSFCDIPLSQIKDHIEKYGDYGIGLTKEWAQRKGLNPVLYVETNSHLSKSLSSLINRFLFGGGTLKEEKESIDMLRYLKNYQGDLTRKTETKADYRFSDEREWRFVPDHNTPCVFLMGSKLSISDESWEKSRTQLDKLVLKFEPNDIKYIIIKDDNEISYFVNFLRNDIEKHHKPHDIDRLSTRILTSKQIMTDV